MRPPTSSSEPPLERDRGGDDVDRLPPSEQATQACRCARAPSGRSRRVRGSRRRRRPRSTGASHRAPRPRPPGCAAAVGALRPQAGVEHRQPYAPSTLPLEAHVAAGPAPQPGDATPGNHEATVDNACGLFRCRSRARFLVTPSRTWAFHMWTTMWNSVNHTCDIPTGSVILQRRRPGSVPGLR